MPLVTFKDLCIDAVDPHAVAPFWARTLGLEAELLDDGDARLSGPDAVQTVWINTVAEPKTVKQRVHLDVLAASLDEFAESPMLTAKGEFPWTTFADPEGGEFCVFTRDDPPAHRLKDIEVDTSTDWVSIAEWWGDVLGAKVVHDDGYSYLDKVPGTGFGVDFVPVPEPKTVKNRIHWDVKLVEGVSLDDLIAKGATVVRAKDDEIRWTVMADPEGNEFCVFAAA